MSELKEMLEFIPVRKPEEAKIGEIIRFIHHPRDGSSVYWLQGILNKRVDKYEVAKKSRWNKNRFRVNNISVISQCGNRKSLPETLTINLTRNSAWSLSTEVELH